MHISLSINEYQKMTTVDHVRRPRLVVAGNITSSTDPFTASEPQNQGISELNSIQNFLSTDFKALERRKGRRTQNIADWRETN